MIQNAGLYSIRAEQIDFSPFHLSTNLRLLYILEGSVQLRFTCGEHLLNAGEIEILNIGEPVQIKNACRDKDNLVLLFEFDGTRATQFNNAIGSGIYNCNSTLFYTSRTLPVDQRILKRKLRLVYRYYISGGDFLIDKTVEEIVLFICERCHDLKNMFQNAAGDDPRGQRFLRVYTFMLEHCEQKINLKRLAEQEYMSPQYLSKEFNDKLGINFKDTLEYFRVIQSVRYLVKGSMAVTQICQRCGFSALRYFYKHFALYLGCTPLEFRSTYLAQPDKVKTFPANYRRVEEIFKTFEYWEESVTKEAKQAMALTLDLKQQLERQLKQKLEQLLKQTLWLAAKTEPFESRDSFCVLCLRGKEINAELSGYLADYLTGYNPAVKVEAVLVFCIENLSEWSEDAAISVARGAAAAERFCQAAAQIGLKTAGAFCRAAERGKIAELLELPSHVTPVLLVAAGRANSSHIREKKKAKKRPVIYYGRYQNSNPAE